VLKHFGVSSGNIATAGRQFPIAARVDIQSALTLGGGHFPLDAGPPQHDEIDVGEPIPVRCLKNELWLS